MNYTQNHHLPQWVKTDRIMMDDFNQAMADMESALNSNAQAAAGAQATADEAKTLASAAYSPDQKPYVTGSYAGNGSTLTVEVGFRPSFVIISGMDLSVKDSFRFIQYTGISGGKKLHNCVTMTNTGFTVTAPSGDSIPNLNGVRQYDYIAFR